MLGLIAADMWIEVEGFLMVSIYDATNRVFEIGPAVGLQGSLVEVVLILSIS